MSKYSPLIGLIKEILPSGERVLVREGDDIINTLRGLDERMIENEVSKLDAFRRAHEIKSDLRKSLYPSDKYSLEERRPLTRELSRKLDTFTTRSDLPELFDRMDSPRSVSSYYFPEEFDKYISPEEIAELSSQHKSNQADQFKAAREKDKLKMQLFEQNPELSDNYDEFYQAFKDPSSDIARERFEKIRAALKAMENK